MPYKNTLKKYEQLKTARLEIVAKLYKRGYSYADIQREVRTQLGMDKGYSLRTVHKDVHTLLNEWRDMRVEDVDDAIQVELARLKELEKEAWQEWDKSKQDHEKKRAKQQRISGEDEVDRVVRMEQQREEVICYGDPRYLDIIHKCGIERRKILGLYAPEKKKLEGDLFANFLMETGIVDEQSEE